MFIYQISMDQAFELDMGLVAQFGLTSILVNLIKLIKEANHRITLATKEVLSQLTPPPPSPVVPCPPVTSAAIAPVAAITVHRHYRGFCLVLSPSKVR